MAPICPECLVPLEFHRQTGRAKVRGEGSPSQDYQSIQIDWPTTKGPRGSRFSQAISKLNRKHKLVAKKEGGTGKFSERAAIILGVLRFGGRLYIITPNGVGVASAGIQHWIQISDEIKSRDGIAVDARNLYVGTRTQIFVHDVVTGQPGRPIKCQDNRKIVKINHDRLAIISEESTLRVYDIRVGKELSTHENILDVFQGEKDAIAEIGRAHV